MLFVECDVLVNHDDVSYRSRLRALILVSCIFALCFVDVVWCCLWVGSSWLMLVVWRLSLICCVMFGVLVFVAFCSLCAIGCRSLCVVCYFS